MLPVNSISWLHFVDQFGQSIVLPSAIRAQFFNHPRTENMAEPFEPAQSVFQIGEDRYGYKYRMSKMRTNGCLVYQCIRGKDQNCSEKCLWLYKSADGHWIATEAPKTSKDPINGGDPMFRTKNPVENINVQQQLEWQYFKPQTLEWEGSMTFTTYLMQGSLPPMIGTRRDLSSAGGLLGSTAAGSDLATVPEIGATPDPNTAATTGSSPVDAPADIMESQQDDVE